MVRRRLGLKIDVDTDKGFREGVPALLDLLAARRLPASFYVALGPDNSGRAVLRIFRQRGFLDKMRRTKAPALYGLKTLFYGTLLPAPLIGASAPRILPQVAAAGHEIGLHGYDHVRWHDRLLKMTAAEVEQEILLAQEIFRQALGYGARAFAAPGWQCSAVSRKVLAEQGFTYASDTRGKAPYWPRFRGEVSALLEIPTTLPTLDELLGFNGASARDFSRLILSRLQPGRPQILTLHAEVEGGPYREEFAWLLDRCLELGVEFFRIRDWAAELLQSLEAIPVKPVQQGTLPGRAGRVYRRADD